MKSFLFASLAVLGMAAHADSIRVFGLPFAEPLDRAFSACGTVPKLERKDYCNLHVALPLGVKRMTATLMRPQKPDFPLPAWLSSDRPVEVRVDSQGAVEEIRAKYPTAREREALAGMVHLFGQPTTTGKQQKKNRQGAAWASTYSEWDTPTIFATLSCGAPNECTVAILTHEVHAGIVAAENRPEPKEEWLPSTEELCLQRPVISGCMAVDKVTDLENLRCRQQYCDQLLKDRGLLNQRGSERSK
jgi:hypothetical protein